jgi:hypothetical protein
MLLSLDFPRDGEVLEPSGIQARPELVPRLKHSGGDAFGINSHRYILIPRELAAGYFIWAKVLVAAMCGQSSIQYDPRSLFFYTSEYLKVDGFTCCQ